MIHTVLYSINYCMDLAMAPQPLHHHGMNKLIELTKLERLFVTIPALGGVVYVSAGINLSLFFSVATRGVSLTQK